MNILYVTDGYLPQFVSGLSISTDEECCFFAGVGDRVSVLARLEQKRGFFYYRNRLQLMLSRAPAAKSQSLPYPVYRYLKLPRAFEYVAASVKPQLIIVHPHVLSHDPEGLMKLFRSSGARVCVNFRSLQLVNRYPAITSSGLLQNTPVITNSEYMKGELVRFFSLPADHAIQVVRPVVHPERYRVNKLLRKYVLFVNPVKEKGLDVALALAATRPDIPFRFVMGWARGSARAKAVEERCETVTNVELVGPVSDMRPQYAGARIVIIPTPNDPSVFVEAWGRVASEAHVSGIPVIATAGGGLTESVGPGGITVPVGASVQEWEAALSLLWDDSASYKQYSEAALSYSVRPEISPRENLSSLRQFLEDVLVSEAG